MRARAVALLAACLAAAPAAAQRVEMNATPEERRLLREQIERAGFMCPEVVLLHAFGPGPRGLIVRAWCGIPGTKFVHRRLVYRLDLEPQPRGLMRVHVRPWDGDPHSIPAR